MKQSRHWKVWIPFSFSAFSFIISLFSVFYLFVSHSYAYLFWCTFASGLIDFLDGKIARKLQIENQFGGDVDSLFDFLNFGFVPGFAFLVYQYSLFPDFTHTLFAFILTCVYVLSALIRLSQFHSIPRVQYYFSGCPSPMAGSSIVLFISLNHMSSSLWSIPSLRPWIEKFSVSISSFITQLIHLHLQTESSSLWFSFSCLVIFLSYIMLSPFAYENLAKFLIPVSLTRNTRLLWLLVVFFIFLCFTKIFLVLLTPIYLVKPILLRKMYDQLH